MEERRSSQFIKEKDDVFARETGLFTRVCLRGAGTP